MRAGGVEGSPVGSYASSAAADGDNAKGVLRTQTFVIDRPTLSFRGAGWNGIAYGPGDWPHDLGNRFNLRDADSGELLMSTAPRNQVGDSAKFSDYAWDVSALAGRSVYFEVIDAIGASESSVYGGGFGWIAVDDIALSGERIGVVNADGSNAFRLRAADGTVVRQAYPSGSDELEFIEWDVSGLQGSVVTFEVHDGIAAEEDGWIAFTQPFGFDKSDATDDDYWSFESGTFDEWEVTGSAFTRPNGDKNGRPLGDDNGKYWADSFPAGESATGSITSKEFTIDRPLLSFLIGGWNGQSNVDPPLNYVELIDENGTTLRRQTPPGQDSSTLNKLVPRTWDVSDLIGQTVRFRVVDGNAGSGYAWLAVDQVRQVDNMDFDLSGLRSNFEWRPVYRVVAESVQSATISVALLEARYLRVLVDGAAANASVELRDVSIPTLDTSSVVEPRNSTPLPHSRSGTQPSKTPIEWVLDFLKRLLGW